MRRVRLESGRRRTRGGWLTGGISRARVYKGSCLCQFSQPVRSSLFLPSSAATAANAESRVINTESCMVALKRMTRPRMPERVECRSCSAVTKDSKQKEKREK